jgi:NAD(P)-dependent dehydrogenase (short-subunit alcohol dehydrogenase family)
MASALTVVDGARPARPVVVLTGATSGVGRATAIAFASRGYRIALIARGEDGLQATLADVERSGGEGLILQADVSNAEQVEAAAAAAVARWGSIDVWVNNAMVTVFSDVSRLGSDELRRVTEVTYLGSVWGTMAALRHMKRQGRGVIVQVGSALSYRSIPLQSAYCGAKSALRGFTDSLRSELIHEDSAIHVTMVHLPAVNTPQFDVARSHLPGRPRPLGTIYQPEIAARAIVWASEHRRRELWVGLPTEQAILGTRVAPGLLDRILAKLGFDGQQSALPHTPQDNLHSPLPGDRGAHGRFDAEAATRSPHLWAATHPKTYYAAIALAGLSVLLALNRRRPTT